MRVLVRYLMTLSLLGLVGCGSGAAPSGDPAAPGGGKADDTGDASKPTIEFGLYTAYLEDDMENGTPLLLAFHKVEGIRAGFAGEFDLTLFNYEEDSTHYISGLFALTQQADRLQLDLKARATGAPDEAGGKFAGWSYDPADKSFNRQVDWVADGSGCADLVTPEGAFSFCRQNQLSAADTARQCLAFRINDYVFDEGFTEWEYPDVDIDRDDDGRWRVWLGSALFDSDEAEIAVTTGRDGALEATVNTEYQETYVVRLPAGIPSRGEVLVGETGGALQQLARIVCYPAPE